MSTIIEAFLPGLSAALIAVGITWDNWSAKRHWTIFMGILIAILLLK